MKKLNVLLLSASVAAAFVAGCAQDKTPDTVVTPANPSSTTVIDHTPAAAPSVNVTTPPATHTSTNTTTTVPAGTSGATTQTSTTTG